MTSVLKDLQDKLVKEYFFDSAFERPLISLEALRALKLTELPYSFYASSLPPDLIRFFSIYLEQLKLTEDIVINSSDVEESEFSTCFKAYSRCLEKLFFDFCMVKGLKFTNYTIEPEYYVYFNFNKLVYNYSESMYNFFILNFISSDFNSIKISPSNSSSLSLAQGLPIILNNSCDLFFEVEEPTPVIIVKVKGV